VVVVAVVVAEAVAAAAAAAAVAVAAAAAVAVVVAVKFYEAGGNFLYKRLEYPFKMQLTILQILSSAAVATLPLAHISTREEHAVITVSLMKAVN
jgi:hypothetical protein